MAAVHLKTSIAEYWGGDIPWFSVVDAPAESDVFVIDTEKHITELGLNNSSTKLLPSGTTIISARGTVGRLALVGRDMAMNQSCYGLRGKYGDDYFTFFTTYRLVEGEKEITIKHLYRVEILNNLNYKKADEKFISITYTSIKENLRKQRNIPINNDSIKKEELSTLKSDIKNINTNIEFIKEALKNIAK